MALPDKVKALFVKVKAFFLHLVAVLGGIVLMFQDDARNLVSTFFHSNPKLAIGGLVVLILGALQKKPPVKPA